jgi:uncharacterized repeat protein (TIGR01451 family)
MKTRAAIFIAAFLLAGPLAVRAQLSMSLSPSVQNSGSGQTLVFSGTLTNTGNTSQIFLNNVQFADTVSGSTYLVSGSNGFYANVPGILQPLQTYTGAIFGIALAGNTPPADYTGTTTLQGGANIFATGNLASQPFTILSPAVSIVATSGSASEYGPISGTFTISRTGGTEIGLPVSYGTGGAAVNGTDYVTISGSATIAAGSSSATVTITPILQQTALGSRTVILTEQTSSLYDPGSQLSDTVTIYDTPFNYWRLEYFGSSANATQTQPTADWSGDGIPNELAYALNLNPSNPNPRLLPTVALQSNYLTLSYVPNPAATDVQYTIQASTDLINWSSANIQSISDSNPGAVAFRYDYPIGSTPQVFMRLQVTPLDR